MPIDRAYYIDATCIHCENCVAVCPTESISMGTRHFVIDTDSCEGCAVCVAVCPPHAIHPLGKVKKDTSSRTDTRQESKHPSTKR